MHSTAVEKWGSKRPLVELSERTGLSLATLSKIKNGGTNNPQNRHMLLIARALEVEPWWLVTGKGPKWTEESGLSRSDKEWLAVGRSISEDQKQAAKALFAPGDKRSPPTRAGGS